MNNVSKREILNKLVSGEISIEEAEERLSVNQIELVEDFARYDLLREERTGIPEIIYSETKSPEAVYSIAKKVLEKKPIVLLSRIREEHVKEIQKLADYYKLEYGTNNNFCRIMHKDFQLKFTEGKIGIITAGTSDIPVAEEAKAIAEMMGCEAIIFNDVGVAGIHRLFEPLQNLIKENIDVLIVAAGMEGALPTVVAGLVDIPVIGLPISTGYGYGGKGQAALMSMLQSCALGLAVVNIDGGISAGAIAAKIAKKRCKQTNV
jgi:NCAIR mutase (PurE)-related protein